MGIHIGQDVRIERNGMCEMLRVDIRGQLENPQGRQQELEQCIRVLAGDMDGRLIENNQRSNNQESLLEELSDAITGLREDMEESRNGAQQIQEKQMRMAQKYKKIRIG